MAVGVAAAPAHHGCTHSVQFYADDAFLLDGLARFVGAALGSGDAAIAIATPAHRGELAERLAAQGHDVELLTRSGRYVALDAAETLGRFTVGRWPDAGRFAEVIGAEIEAARSAATSEGRHVAAYGEMVALLWADGKPDAAIRLEQLWNDLAGSHAFRLHCAYPMGLFPRAEDGAPIARICAEHAHVTPAEGYAGLVDEDERLRAIVVLQQQAQALAAEVEERKRAQADLERREAELRRAVEVRDEFLSAAAHELKTPLTSLRGFAQLLLRSLAHEGKIEPRRFEQSLRAIEMQSGKINDLVERLLDTAQIEAGRLRLQPEPTELVGLVRTALAQRPVGAAHTVVFQAPDELVAAVDRDRFEQAVTNLFDNAVKFSPKGGVVEVELGRDDLGRIRLSVADEGVGVPAAEHGAIFDRFYRSDAAGHLSGLGLGLYITRVIAELHGGSVAIEELGHRGSCFVLTLPPAAARVGPAG